MAISTDPYIIEMLQDIEVSAVIYTKLKKFSIECAPLPHKRGIQFQDICPYKRPHYKTVAIIAWQAALAHDNNLPYIVYHLYHNKVLLAEQEVNFSAFAFEEGKRLATLEIKRLYKHKYDPLYNSVEPPNRGHKTFEDVCPKYIEGKTETYYYYDAQQGNIVSLIGPRKLSLTFLPSYTYTNIIKHNQIAHHYYLDGKRFDFVPAVQEDDIKECPTVYQSIDVTSLFNAKAASGSAFYWPRNLTRLLIPIYYMNLANHSMLEFLKQKYRGTRKLILNEFAVTESMFNDYIEYIVEINKGHVVADTPIIFNGKLLNKHAVVAADVFDFDDEDEEEIGSQELLELGGIIRTSEMQELLDIVEPSDAWDYTMTELYGRLKDA